MAGWTVSNTVDPRPFWIGLTLAGILAVSSGLGLLWQFFPGLIKAAKLASPRWREFFAIRQFMPGERSGRGYFFPDYGRAITASYGKDPI